MNLLCARRLTILAVVPALLLQPVGAYAGGYVPPGGTQLKQASSISLAGSGNVAPTFNNATLTDRNLIAETNNHLIKTPSTSDPVSTVTGNNYHDETDFVIKGRAGLNYAFTRTYNSSSARKFSTSGLGAGWTHSYAMTLTANDYGNCPNCSSTQAPENGNGKTSSITYTDERGGDHNYLVNESSFAVTPPQGEFDSLALNTPATGQHTLTFRNGTKYVFKEMIGSGMKTTPGVVANLIQIADPWGNQLNLAYANGMISTITDNLGIAGRTGLRFNYDSLNPGDPLYLSSIVDWTGRRWTYTPDATSASQLETYTNPLLDSVSYGYAANAGGSVLISMTKPLRGVQTTFSYYQNGRTFNYQDAQGNTETLDYDLYRKTTRVTDPRGGVRVYEYDTSGRLTKLIEPDGAVLFFQNTTTDGVRYSKKDGLGYQTQYSYRSDKTFNTASDTFGNVTREQDALAQTIDTTYGVYDQVATVKDKRGTVATTSFHTASGACAAIGKPNTVTLSALGAAINVKLRTYCWNADGTLASQTDYLNPSDTSKTRVTTYTYDTTAHLNVQSVAITGWDGSSVTKSYTYDSLGRAKTETLARRNTPTDATLINLTTTTTYDALDRVTQVQDPAGNLFINRFDANGQLWQVTHQYKKTDSSFDTRNIVTRSFDSTDRVQTETDANGGVTTYTYDAAGNVTSVTDPENHTLHYEYDAMNRRTAVTDANGRSVHTTYDLAGHPVSVTNGANETTTTTYDKIGRPVSVTDPHGYVTTFTYDANNNRTCAIDANAQAGLQPKNSDGCTVSSVYDELNRPTLVRDALNGTTAITYDLLGNPLTQIDAEGRKYTWVYDGLGRLTNETDFAGNTTSYALDQAGNPYQKTNRLNEITQTTFDTLNRPTSVLYKKDNSTETLSYDPAGTVHATANAGVTYTFGYDTLNRLISKMDSRGRSLSFTWDKSGHMLTKTTYQGSTTSYTYDGAGTLVAARNPDYLSVNYQFDNAGRLLTRVMSSGARSVYAYDSGGWLQSIQHLDANGATVGSQGFVRDRVANITSQTTSTGVTSYALDALYRLKTVSAPAAANSEAFTYDHIGNRLTATRGGTVAGAAGSTTKYYVYTAASQTGAVTGYTPTYNNRLKEIHLGSLTGTLDSSFTFDNEGRLTTQTGTSSRTFTWDAKGRVNTLTQGGSTETYAYDPMNYRIGRSGGTLGSLNYYLEGEHLESVEQAGAVTEKYFRGSSTDELVAGFVTQNSKLTPFFFQHDQVMSVSAQTKPNGGTQAGMSYWAFGENQSTTGTSVSRLQYTGRENDGGGLYYYRARYYDPTIGRFVSEDPKGLAAGSNLFAYSSNNPVNANDPMGLDPYTSKYPTRNEAAIALSKDILTTPGSASLEYGAWIYKSQARPARFSYTSLAAATVRSDGTGQDINVPYTLVPKAYRNIAVGQASLLHSHPYGIEASPSNNDITQDVSNAAMYGRNGVSSYTAFLLSFEDQQLKTITTTPSGQTTTSSIWSVPDVLMPARPNKAGDLTNSDLLPTAGSSASDDEKADGGFLLYPNKPNTNQLQSVYGK